MRTLPKKPKNKFKINFFVVLEINKKPATVLGVFIKEKC